MRRLSILTFVSLDGVMQAPMQPEEDRSGNFQHGGWASPFYEEVMPMVGEEAMAEPFDLLFGRKTYDVFAGHWPNQKTGDAAGLFNAATKYVATSRPEGLPWTPAVALSGDVAKEIARLKESEGPLLQVHGSGELIQLLLANDLIDEYRLVTFPVVIGSGKRLFADGALPTRCELLKSRATKSGVVMNRLRPIRGSA